MTLADIYSVASAVIVSLGGGALLVFALSSWLAKVWANRILEREKASYAVEIETLRRTYGEEIERVKTELQKNAFESKHVKEMVTDVQYKEVKQQVALEQETIDLCKRLDSVYYGQKIFLEKDICDKVEAILKSIQKAISDFRQSQDRGASEWEDPGARAWELWGEAVETMEKAVPPLRAELEETFRIMLSQIGPAA